MGFAVMVWAVAGRLARQRALPQGAEHPGALIRGRDGKPVLIEWWNGYSAAIDFTPTRQAAPGCRSSSPRCKRTMAWTASVRRRRGAQFYLPAQEASGRSAADFTAAWFVAAQYAYNEVKDTLEGGRKAPQPASARQNARLGREGLVPHTARCVQRRADRPSIPLSGHGGRRRVDELRAGPCHRPGADRPLRAGLRAFPDDAVLRRPVARALAKTARACSARQSSIRRWGRSSGSGCSRAPAPASRSRPDGIRLSRLRDGGDCRPVCAAGRDHRCAHAAKGRYSAPSACRKGIGRMRPARFAGGEVTVPVDPDRLPRFSIG